MVFKKRKKWNSVATSSGVARRRNTGKEKCSLCLGEGDVTHILCLGEGDVTHILCLGEGDVTHVLCLGEGDVTHILCLGEGDVTHILSDCLETGE
jgi:hypothetical protein